MSNRSTMKYGLLTYKETINLFNIGDYIQSLAAKRFLPKIDAYINREEMASYQGESVKLILNGWFTHNVQNWVPSNKILPLFISFHINSSSAPFILNSNGLAYLKKYQPIGCRDHFTVNLLKTTGIEAYYSGCLTTTLDHYAVPDNERTDDVYIVDPFYSYPDLSTLFNSWKYFVRGIVSGDVFKLGKKHKHMMNIFTPQFLKNAKYETHLLPADQYSDEEKFNIAEKLLKKYAKAKLVVTSRIHCALPCLAMGTPVIFINAFNSFVDTCRFDGISNLFNRVDVDHRGIINSNFNLKDKIDIDTKVNNLKIYKELSKNMKVKCRGFIEV
jgi:hypothetical protein